MALPSKSSTTFTTLGSMMSAGVLIGVATVLIEACGSSSRESTAASTAAGSNSGSSPWTFTKTSRCWTLRHVGGHLRHALGTGAVIRARHSGFAAELLHRFHNAFIIG